MKNRRFVKDETRFDGQYDANVIELLFLAYRPFRWRIAGFIVTGFVGRLLLLANANLVSWWADAKARPEWLKAFSTNEFIWLLAVVTGVGFVFTSIFRIAFSRTSARAISRLYDEVTLRTSRLSMSFFDTQPVGRIVTRFSSDYGNVFRLFGGPLSDFFAIVFDLVAMSILIGFANPWFLALFVAVGVLQGLVYRFNQPILRRERREVSASRSPSIAHFAESAQGATTIRVFDRVPTFFARFRRLNSDFLRRNFTAVKYFMFFSLQMGGLTALLLLSTGTLGYYLIESQQATIASIGVAFAFVMLSANSIQTFFEWMGNFEEALTGVERLSDYLRRDLEPGLKLPSSATFDLKQPRYSDAEERQRLGERLTLRRAAGLQVKDLRFRYASDLPLVLDGVSFDIKAGEKVGIVGRTGSGKSSLIQALFRLYPIEHGDIRIESHSASVGGDGADLAVYRRSMAYIAQEPTLFKGRLRENLDLQSRHSDAVLVEALERVELGSWLREQAHGLDTEIEEKGKNLSAGERQLLCMARCLLQDAPIVVMDEATSAIDPQTEEVLVKATEEFFSDRTQIIIAHRLSTLIHCDRILWLKGGRVRMYDSPAVVLPLFREAELSAAY